MRSGRRPRARGGCGAEAGPLSFPLLVAPPPIFPLRPPRSRCTLSTGARMASAWQAVGRTSASGCEFREVVGGVLGSAALAGAALVTFLWRRIRGSPEPQTAPGGSAEPGSQRAVGGLWEWQALRQPPASAEGPLPGAGPGSPHREVPRPSTDPGSAFTVPPGTARLTHLGGRHTSVDRKSKARR